MVDKDGESGMKEDNRPVPDESTRAWLQGRIAKYDANDWETNPDFLVPIPEANPDFLVPIPEANPDFLVLARDVDDNDNDPEEDV